MKPGTYFVVHAHAPRIAFKTLGRHYSAAGCGSKPLSMVMAEPALTEAIKAILPVERDIIIFAEINVGVNLGSAYVSLFRTQIRPKRGGDRKDGTDPG